METLEQTVARQSVGKHVQQYRLFSVWSARGATVLLPRDTAVALQQ
jgi:hypothetical protein